MSSAPAIERDSHEAGRDPVEVRKKEEHRRREGSEQGRPYGDRVVEAECANLRLRGERRFNGGLNRLLDFGLHDFPLWLSALMAEEGIWRQFRPA